MIEKSDIKNLDDIKLLVNSFYQEVRNDTLLGPIFNNVIKNNWPQHLDKMYRFWQTVLLEEHTYHGGPFPPHAKLPINAQHFNRWLSIFEDTLQKNFDGEKAKEAKWRAQKMAQMFQLKIEFLQSKQ